ncbi:TRAP transporter small permease [Bacillus sp. Marseille-P3661]|uniref:TRAP transporter small permease n=1 Tax=Bacillus sp. Marseille-P3661 TaxID=1936234 RepID=UPI000C82295C|nr:TRAP transporter small permease [Bacillus sp. Marseille-P3661]
MSFLQTLDRWMMKIEEAILSYAIIIIAIMVVGNVLNRVIFGSSWAFSAEISKFSVILATFMGIGYAARKGRHINMSAFFDMAPYKLRKALAVFIPFVTAIILFILTYFAYVYLVSVYESGRVTSALQVPEYLMISFVPIGLLLGGLQFIRNAWINVKEKDVYLATEQKDYSA